MKDIKTAFGTAFCGITIFASCAFAQEAVNGAAQAGAALASESGAESGVEVGGEFGDEFGGDLAEGESLIVLPLCDKYIPDSGFTPMLVWTGEQWSNVGGGLGQGTTWDSLFTVSFEQDFSKLTRCGGLGSFGISAFYYTQSGDFSQDLLGGGSDASNIFSGEMTRVFEIYYHNEFETEYGNFGFRIGQLAADEDFMGIDYADIFLNSSFGAIPANACSALANGMNAFSQYALATAGITFFWSNEDLDFIIGFYNGDCGEDISSNHGFDYELSSIAIWYQLGYNYCLWGLNGRAQFGGNFHNGDFEDFYSGDSDRNFYSFYVGVQQDIIIDAKGKCILGGFVRAAWAPDENIAVCTKYVDCGLNWFAPIPSRGDDVFAVGYSVIETGAGARNAGGLKRFENMLEVAYRAQITGSIAFQPTFQTYFNTVDKNGDTRSAFVVGARVEINF